ncbi:hypothetical protein Ccrd_021565 [Cynara cardunculus var. scolymus]|uniref:Uncharacterized protein n=1 Tax=Cynara cardunculus var. scolymus TaxID=59895 RepID=A0A103Y0B3_CYNCS|nr:hypothetical protein Ccrd_021565 [Cynara cardunculus var. scolymus]
MHQCILEAHYLAHGVGLSATKVGDLRQSRKHALGCSRKVRGISIPGNTVSHPYILEVAVCSLETVHAIGFAFDFKFRLSFAQMKNIHRGVVKKPNNGARVIITAIAGVVFGYLIGVNFPYVAPTKITLPSCIHSSSEETMTIDQSKAFEFNSPEFLGSVNTRATPQIYVPTNPRGAEPLPPGIVVPETDLYLRRLWGDPSEDLKKKPKYLVAFTVGWGQREMIDASVKKFSEDFQILLFHYDGRTTEWDRYEWSKQAIHVSVKRQTKWWYAKRFMHPDVVAPYEYIFVWDEDLGVEHFNADRYIYLVKKHGLAISQPGLEPNNGLTWQMTKRRGDKEVHKDTEEKPGWCSDPHLPPCAADYGSCVLTGSLAVHVVYDSVQYILSMGSFANNNANFGFIMHMKNDLVHGWGLDFALRRCVEPAHEKIGVVDSQWIVHQVIPTLGSQVSHCNLYMLFIVACMKLGSHCSSSHSYTWESGLYKKEKVVRNPMVCVLIQGNVMNGKYGWLAVKDRCKTEWLLFQDRLANAEKAYFKKTGRRLN